MTLKAPFMRSVRLGVSSLLLHKLRSLLTTLGVLFGVSSVIAMLAIGEGASEEAQEQIRQLGSQNIILRSVKPPDDLVSNQSTRVSSYGLTWDDFEAVRDTFPWVTRAVPVRSLVQEVRFQDKLIHPRVLATTSAYQEVTGRMLHRGRFLGVEDQRRVANVCVLGYEVSRSLFPVRPAIGEKIKIGPEYFDVVGILLPRVPLGDDMPAPGVEITSEVLIPLSTGRRWFGDM